MCGRPRRAGGCPDFGSSTRVSKNAARAIQIPDSAPRHGFWINGQFPRTALGPSRIQVPRLAPDLGTLNRFQDPEIANSPCRIQITRLALRFGNSRSRSRSFAIERQNTVDSRFRVSTFYFRACTRYLSFIPCVSRLPPVSFYGVRYLDGQYA